MSLNLEIQRNVTKRTCNICGEGFVTERTAQKWFKEFKKEIDER